MGENRIYLVEDDVAIAGELAERLGKWGFDCFLANDFTNIIAEFEEIAPSLVLMDISLPSFSGYHWCKEIRNLSDVPIIFLTSFSDKMNLIMAIEMGGDDYISKPFDISVLLAKIKALLRRSYGMRVKKETLEVSGVVLHLDAMKLQFGEKTLELSKNEFIILSMMMENSGQVTSKADIIERIWSKDDFIDDNTLNVNIARLRKRLKHIGLVDFIKTIKGAGYMVE